MLIYTPWNAFDVWLLYSIHIYIYIVQEELIQHPQQQKLYNDQHAKPLKQLEIGDSILESAKDGKWKVIYK